MSMSRLQKLRAPHVLKWVSLLCSKNLFTSSKSSLYVDGSCHLLHDLKCFSTESAFTSKNGGIRGELSRISPLVRREAQAALLEYFHSTRSFQITDAENMSKNTPEFFDGLLKKVDVNDKKVGRSLARFLRYNPVNEFEPFFESIGLKPSEYVSFLPRNSIFLNDDQLLLDNYYVLCNYGLPRNRIGKVYKEAREVFQYEYGVLKSKLQSFRNLGLKQSLVVKIIASSPHLLKGNVDQEFVEVLEKFKEVGLGHDWLEEHISLENSYDWKCMFQLMCLLTKLGFNEEQVGKVLTEHPSLLLECSGRVTFCLLGFLLKFGSTPSDVQNIFLNFPKISVLEYFNNLCQCYNFLVEIDMAVQDIVKIVGSYTTLLGSCELKKVRSLMSVLNCGKNKLCEMVNEDPYVLEKWILGVRVGPLNEQKRVVKVKMLKTEFLLSLGFVEESKDMEKALKVLRGRGVELQERFDCLVNTGLSRDEVIQMVKASPQILNQSKDVIETKIGFFVNELGYKVSDLLTHPKLLSYTIERVKLRLLMYKWLKDERVVHPRLALSTLLSSSHDRFVKTYVHSHPRGPEYWERLRKKYTPADDK